MKLLELFCGTCSVSNALCTKYHHCEVVSLDILPKFNATITVDILDWDYTIYQPKHFDIIWASPPCTSYSKAHRKGVRNLDLADAIVKQTLTIIEYLQPNYWYIENPSDGGLLQHRDFMQSLTQYKHTCSYCKYGFDYRKTTNIWTNKQNLELKMCSKKTSYCDTKMHYGKHIETAQRTRSSNANVGYGVKCVESAYRIPYNLILDLMP